MWGFHPLLALHIYLFFSLIWRFYFKAHHLRTCCRINHHAISLFSLISQPALLVTESQRLESLIVNYWKDWFPEWFVRLHESDRGRLPSITESMIVAYVIGFCVEEVQELFESGIKRYVGDMWNIVDFLSNFFYLLWLSFRIISLIQVRWLPRQEEEMMRVAGLLGMHPDQETREEWDPYDPMFLSEGFFAAANILSFLKLVNVFSVHPHLGPLQISLGRMVFDIIKFFFIYTWVVFAFGCGLHYLLWFHSMRDYTKCKDPSKDLDNVSALEQDHACSIWRRFSNLFETTQTLFWASFGLIDLSNFEMSGIKDFTRFWGLLMYGSYSIINVVVLLNLLIAMMSDSYQLISSSRDTEWKFARSKLWINYFDDERSIRPPPPFNLIPSLKCFFSCCFGRSPKTSPGRSTIRRKAGFRSSQTDQGIHEQVMRSLVRRYVIREQRKAEETGPVTEDDVKEIKQDISSFRFELFDLLRENGFKSTHLSETAAGEFRK